MLYWVDMEKTWCGRYLLIAGDILLTDMCATLPVFYGKGYVSNSLYAISQLVHYPYRDPGTSWGIDFIPGRRTQYDDIFRLLPEQYLDYVSQTTHTRPLLPDGVMGFSSEEERAEAFIEAFSRALKEMRREFDGCRIVLPLTGGVDSRTIFSFLVRNEIPFSAITYAYPGIGDGDRLLPRELCGLAGIPYEYITPTPCSRKEMKRRRDEYRIFTMGLDGDMTSKYHYSHRIYEGLYKTDKEQILVLGGSTWEICVNYYHREGYHTGPFSNETIESMEEIEEAFPDLKLRSNVAKRQAAVEWLEMIKAAPENDVISDVNRLFWDLREGVWLGNDRSYDMYDGLHLIQPFNARYFISIMYGFDAKDRMDKGHQKKIIGRLCPRLSGIPYADDMAKEMPWCKVLAKAVAQRIRHEAEVIPYAIANYGLMECIRYYLIKMRAKYMAKA